MICERRAASRDYITRYVKKKQGLNYKKFLPCYNSSVGACFPMLKIRFNAKLYTIFGNTSTFMENMDCIIKNLTLFKILKLKVKYM